VTYFCDGKELRRAQNTPTPNLIKNLKLFFLIAMNLIGNIYIDNKNKKKIFFKGNLNMKNEKPPQTAASTAPRRKRTLVNKENNK
jgi:hypothetical protein